MMKRLVYLLALALLLPCVAMSQSTTESEVREYSQGTAPGEMYFIETKEFSGGTYTFTNNLPFMWYPSRIETWYASAVNSTNSFVHIYKHTELQFQKYEVVTNEFGNVATNYLHGLTNTVNTYVTNTIASWEHSSEARKVATAADTTDYFIQKGDIVKFVSGITNAVRVRFIGRR